MLVLHHAVEVHNIETDHVQILNQNMEVSTVLETKLILIYAMYIHVQLTEIGLLGLHGVVAL